MSNIIFENKVQVALWNIEYLPQISDGFWNITNMDPVPWQRAKVSDGDEPGTDIPKWVKRYTLDNNGLLDDIGYRMLAIARYQFFIGSAVSLASPILDLMIKIDYKDENRDYRNVQVLTPGELRLNISHFRSSSFRKYNKILLDLEMIGIHLDMIYRALTDKSYSIKMFRKDILSMDKITRTFMKEKNV